MPVSTCNTAGRARPQARAKRRPGIDLGKAVEHWRDVLRECLRLRAWKQPVQNEHLSAFRQVWPHRDRLIEMGDEKVPTTSLGQRGRHSRRAEAISVRLHHCRAGRTAEPGPQQDVVRANGGKIDCQYATSGGRYGLRHRFLQSLSSSFSDGRCRAPSGCVAKGKGRAKSENARSGGGFRG
jgi:hypothetical protein